MGRDDTSVVDGHLNVDEDRGGLGRHGRLRLVLSAGVIADMMLPAE